MKLSGSTKKLLIRIGLFLLYLIIGAGVFVAIESSTERDEREKIEIFVKTVEKIRQNKSSLTGNNITKFLEDFKHALLYGYNIESKTLAEPKWSYMNSFFFVGNIVTTIGKSRIAFPLSCNHYSVIKVTVGFCGLKYSCIMFAWQRHVII